MSLSLSLSLKSVKTQILNPQVRIKKKKTQQRIGPNSKAFPQILRGNNLSIKTTHIHKTTMNSNIVCRFIIKLKKIH